MEGEKILQALMKWTGLNTWVVQVFIVVFIALVASYIQRILFKRLQRKLERTQNPWDDALINAMQRPLTLLIWILGISLATDIIYRETGTGLFGAIGPVRDVSIIATITWFLLRLVNNFQANIIRRQQQTDVSYDRTTLEAMSKLLRASVVITAALVALQTLGFSISGVLAFGGIGGIAVGFAAKDLLANFFGGLMLYLDRPFAIGDWIRSPDRDIEGTVEHIGWRLTRIRSFDKRPIYVPNSVFATIAVINPQRMTHRRIYETIGIRYADLDRMESIVSSVHAMLEQHPAIDASQTLMVNFTTFGPSSCDFFVYTFTRTTVWTEFHAVKQDVLLKIAAIIAEQGAEIAFPTRTLHLQQELGSPEQLAEPSKA